MRADAPRRRSLLLAAAVAAAWGSSAPIAAQVTVQLGTSVEEPAQDGVVEEVEEGFDGIVYSARSAWPAIANKGWYPARVELENRSERAERVTVTGTLGWRAQFRVEHECTLAPGERREVELLLPAHYFERSPYYGGARVQVEARGDVTSRNASVDRERDDRLACVLALLPSAPAAGAAEIWAARLSTEQVQDAEPHIRRVYGVIPTIPMPTGTKTRGNVELATALYGDMASRHEAYSSLDLVIVAGGADLPSDEALAPLLAWARLGGSVAFVGRGAREALAGRNEIRPWLEERFRVARVEAEHGAPVEAFSIGLGRLIVGSGAEPFASDAERDFLARMLAESVPTVPGPSRNRPLGWRLVSAALPIPDLGALPLRQFALVLILFYVLIGPVNFLIVLRRFKKPWLLLVTVPALAAAFSAGLLVYGILHQGIDVRGTSSSLTLLDERRHHAEVLETRQIFAGHSPGPGLRPAAGTTCYPSPSDELDDRLRFRVDQGEERVFSGGFLRTRTPHDLILHSDRASRLRLEVREGGASLAVDNGLEARILDLVVIDSRGAPWRSRAPIEPGATAELDRMDGVGDAEALVASLAEGAVGPGELLGGKAGALVPGSYFARLERSPFTDDCGIAMREVAGLHTVLGILPTGSPEAQGDVR